jgi:hypothetical protein
MVLFVRDGCRWCEQFKNVPGMVIAKMVATPRGLKARLEDTLIDPPVKLSGFPALLDGEKIYVGKAAVEQRLRNPT